MDNKIDYINASEELGSEFGDINAEKFLELNKPLKDNNKKEENKKKKQ
jgi:hypothetical protein